MDKSYLNRFQMFSESLSDLQLISYARKNGTNNFFKKAKMPLKIYCYVAFLKRDYYNI